MAVEARRGSTEPSASFDQDSRRRIRWIAGQFRKRAGKIVEVGRGRTPEFEHRGSAPQVDARVGGHAAKRRWQ
jgi:hypothetical protein